MSGHWANTYCTLLMGLSWRTLPLHNCLLLLGITLRLSNCSLWAHNYMALALLSRYLYTYTFSILKVNPVRYICWLNCTWISHSSRLRKLLSSDTCFGFFGFLWLTEHFTIPRKSTNYCFLELLLQPLLISRRILKLHGLDY